MINQEKLLVSFRDYIETLKEPEKNLILKRIDGITLAQLSKESGLSAEGIRKKEKKILNEIRKETGKIRFTEEEYGFVFSQVSFDPDFWEYAVSVYPEMKSARYYCAHFLNPETNLKKKDILTGISGNMDKVPDKLMNCIIDYYDPVILENGMVYRDYNADLIAELLRELGPKTITELEQMHLEGTFVQRYGKFSPYEKDYNYFVSSFPYCKNVIRTGKKPVYRFYDYERYRNKIGLVLSKLIFPEEEQKIHAGKVYELNKKALKKIGIKNGYELHSLIRKRTVKVPKGFKPGKFPMIYIASADVVIRS